MKSIIRFLNKVIFKAMLIEYSIDGTILFATPLIGTINGGTISSNIGWRVKIFFLSLFIKVFSIFWALVTDSLKEGLDFVAWSKVNHDQSPSLTLPQLMITQLLSPTV